MEIKIIPVDQIRPSPFQPRELFEKEKISELADSIKGGDLVQPILVRKKGDTYEIIAGERRWRAYQFAGMTEIPAIEREADDIEARELGLMENWHRLALEPGEAERFLANLFKDGTKIGRYASLQDMSKKTGIHRSTLQEIILAHNERDELSVSADTLTYTDFQASRILKDEPEVRKQVLELRERGKLTRDNLREFSKAITEASEPVRKALLKDNSQLTAENARIIDTELSTVEEKTRAIDIVERETSRGHVRPILSVIRQIEQERPERVEVVKEIDTGDVWVCPECNKKFRLMHVEPHGTHRFEEVIE